MTEQLHSIGLAARNEEKNRQREVLNAEHIERMKARGFLKDGKWVPDPHPGRVTKWHLQADSRTTPLVPESRNLVAAPFQLLHREVLLIPIDPLPNGRIPCADCGQPARFTVIEQADTKAVRGWQWCGMCQVG